MSITPYCDCWGFSSPSLVPDIGILAGTDIVAIEQASLDMIHAEDFIPSSLPENMEIMKENIFLKKFTARILISRSNVHLMPNSVQKSIP